MQYNKRGYLLENFRLFHLRTEEGTRVESHYHEFCKLLLLLSGRGSYVVEGRRYTLQPGDVVLIGSHCVHRPELDSGSVYERVIIYISPEFLKQASTGDCELTELFSGQYGHVLRLGEKGQRKLQGLTASLEKELSAQEYGRTIASNAALLRLMVEIGRSFRQENSQNPLPDTTKNPRILELKQYIDDHVTEDVDIDMLAERFFISKYHMMRLFRQETGSTVNTYLTLRRLSHARELMDKGMRATEACYRSGFRSYSSFTRAYGKHFGTTPTGRMDGSFRWNEGIE